MPEHPLERSAFRVLVLRRAGQIVEVNCDAIEKRRLLWGRAASERDRLFWRLVGKTFQS